MPISQQLEMVVLALCEDTNTPRALTVWLMVKHEEFGQLVNLTTDPLHYLTSSHYRQDVQVTSFLRKYQGLTIPGVDKAKVALRKFYEAEAQCAKTNSRLGRFLHNSDLELEDLVIAESLGRIKSTISSVLGRLPLDLEHARFGPGATFEDRGRLTTVPDKITSRPTSTRAAWTLRPLWERTAWARSQYSVPFRGPLYSRGNRFTTVPKDAKTDRGIAIEPSINVYYQLGVGTAIRQRLRKVGIDLNNGQMTHRRKARDASRDASHSTIDLSSASDTVSKCLVKLLLPSEWWELLDLLRSPLTFVDGRWIWLEKFSSMGNGYTFELETLIFYSIAVEACHLCGQDSSTVLVYGDDIIAPTNSSGVLLSLLRYLGFSPNSEKTFLSGVFRESCGGDYFLGEDVRPYFQKELLDEPQKWITLANGLRRIGETFSDPIFDHSCWSRARKIAIGQLPASIRNLRGPASLGDAVITELDTSRWSSRRTRDGRTSVLGYLPVPELTPLHHWRSDVIFASALYGIPSRGVLPRGGVSGFRKSWVPLGY